MNKEKARYYFVGPKWLIELMRQAYGDAIDYIEQKPLPKVQCTDDRHGAMAGSAADRTKGFVV